MRRIQFRVLTVANWLRSKHERCKRKVFGWGTSLNVSSLSNARCSSLVSRSPAAPPLTTFTRFGAGIYLLDLVVRVYPARAYSR